MRQHKVFLRHELLKYNSEKSTAKSSALENYISSANLSLSGCSSAEPNSVSVGRCKFQLKKLYLQTVKKVDHLPNEIIFAVEKKKYLDSVENTLKKGILQESIKIPNLQNLNDAERKDKMIELLEKTSKENNIPFSAFEEVFKDSEKMAKIFALLRFGESKNNQFEETKIERKNKLGR